MTDFLILFAAFVVAPVGFVLSVLVVGAVVIDIRRDWRAEFQTSSPAAYPPRFGEGAAPVHGRTGAALPRVPGPRAVEPANARRAVREAVGSASASSSRRRGCS